MNLQAKINDLYNPTNKLSLEGYHHLLRECVNQREFAATVFVYDHLLNNGFKATPITFNIIEKLHSKTLPENHNIYLKPDLKKRLAPRRRIHKIIKGANYSKNYESAKIYTPKVKAFLTINPELKSKPRIALAKSLSKGCHISFNDARYIITALKREGFLTKTGGAEDDDDSDDDNSSSQIKKDTKIKKKLKVGNVKTLDNFFTVTSK